MYVYIYIGGGFNYFLFSPLLEEMIQFDYYFFNWVVQPQTMYLYICRIYYVHTDFENPNLRCLKPDKTTFLTTRRSRAFSRAPWADSTWASTGSETCWGVLRFVETHFCGVIFGQFELTWPIWLNGFNVFGSAYGCRENKPFKRLYFNSRSIGE